MLNQSENTTKAKLTSGIAEWLMRPIPSAGARRVAATSLALSTDVGTQREENQDRIVAAFAKVEHDPILVLAVADGMGGMVNGQKCAAVTLAALLAEIVTSTTASFKTRLRNAALYADYCVYSDVHGNGGSTMSAIVIKGGHAPETLHVGDSRIYSITKSSITRLTRDDTIEGQFKDIVDPKIAESERHRLLQFIGMGADLEPHIQSIDEPNSSFLITSDGANVCGDDILKKICSNAEPGSLVKRTTEISKWLGSDDNITALFANGLNETFNHLSNTAENNSLVVWDCFGERTQILPESSVTPVQDNKEELPKRRNKPPQKNRKDKPSKNQGSESKPHLDKEDREPKELQIEFFKGTKGE